MDAPKPTPAEAKELRPKVVARLLTLKQALATLEDLGLGADEVEDDDDDFEESDETIASESEHEEDSDKEVSPYGLKPGEKVSLASGGEPSLQNLEETWQKDKIAQWMNAASPSKAEKPKKKVDSELGKLEEGELEALMQDALDLDEQPELSSPPRKKKKSEAPESPEQDGKKKKKASPSKPIFDLVEPEFPATKPREKKKGSPAPSADTDLDALGDPTLLSHTDASDKAGRRRSLRFHTSKIERRVGLYARSGILIKVFQHFKPAFRSALRYRWRR